MRHRRQLYFHISLLIVLLWNGSIVHSQDEQEKSISTSIAGMEELLMSEKILINTVERFADELQAKVNALKNLVTVLRNENDKALQSPEKYLHNPLNGFSLIRRMHYDWNNIELYMTKPVGESYIEVIRKYRHEMPSTNDLFEASEAIHRLQTTYDMRIDDVVRGVLNGKQYDVKLSAVDCYFMGLHLSAKKNYYLSGFWLYNAIETYQNSDYNTIIDYGLDKPNALYAEALEKQLRYNDALIVIKKALSFRPDDADLTNRKNQIELQAKTYNGPPISYSKPGPSAYEEGCRGKYANKPSKLHCVYNTTTSAFLRLAPLKMEILNLEPYMVLFHDIISDQEISDLQNLAKPNLKRATVFNKSQGKSTIVEKRTSKFSWFQDNTSNTTIRLNQRIRDMTGFDILGSEMLQVMNYGLGGHYDTHFDYFDVPDTSDVVQLNGNRIATVLFYMTDVEQGGATVFPNLKTAVFPRKGTAVMWYNLDNKLEGDPLTLHAACPVIVGSKWVCNKWIRSKAQIFRKPCYNYNNNIIAKMHSNACWITTFLLMLATLNSIDCMTDWEKSFSTSIAGMENLLLMESTLIASVQQFTEELEQKVRRLKSLLDELQTENQKGLDNTEEYLHNPLNGYALIRRMYYDWPNIELFMSEPINNAHVEVIQQLRPQMPSYADLSEACEAIYRLQITYGLDPADMVEGILNNKQYNVQMKPLDRYFMGYYLFGQEKYFHSAYWTYQAIMSHEDSDYNAIMDFGLEKVYALYGETLVKQNRVKDALVAIQHAFTLKPHDARLMQRRNAIELLVNTTTDEASEFLVPEADPYQLGCRGFYSNYISNLHCLYNRTAAPFLHLAPLKMEILQLDPYMVLYHDMISDNEIEELKNMARPDLKRATVYSDDNKQPIVVRTRTAKSTGIDEQISATTRRLNQRIMDMTGMDTEGSEALQIMNYGLGGHYDTHYDFFNVSSGLKVVKEGDRIATVLIYLSEVEQGGATVFPNIPTAVFPQKGSALVWYNLKNDLEGNWLTLHAACPVLVGSKWVANKWLRSKAQMFRRPCYK
ncbi:uncharacterized protein LOC101899183 [Musca domestica]|uniref:procollagen-proline 4-dioxygenase n=1 Tax=Musca domestica TaxID=7370 RepID=A0ABM3VA77_MUSDO|nr:uncharacterized protein LOC101899183 [Musca domestica]